MILGLIGYGTIARLALEALTGAAQRRLDSIVCLARPDGIARAQSLGAICAPLTPDFRVVSDVEAMIAMRPQIVAEAAGHGAVRGYAPRILAAGIDVLVTSTGTLADPSLRAELREAEARGRSKLSLCAGAVGSLDLLAAARLSGLSEVVYTSRKPPRAWRGTMAEERLDLEKLSGEQVFYEGTADVAARDFPQNANVAATIAMMGAGFERTHVRLVADARIDRNVHELRVRSSCVDYEIRIEGRAAPDNPKTSLTTAYALASDLLARLSLA